MKTVVTILTLIAVVASGCVSTPPDALDASVTSALKLTAGSLSLTSDAAQGTLSALTLDTGAATFVTFPAGVLLLTDDGYVPALGPVALGEGETLRYLPAYGAKSIELLFDNGEKLTLDLTAAPRERLVSGDFAVDELARQRDMFPHRTPGMPNYAASQAYFAEFFKSLNMEVEVDPFGTMMLDDQKVPVGPAPGPSSAANVVGIKRGTLSPERYLVVGGHYDVVEGTTEGAFDNTGGAVATMAFARAFANVTTQHTLIFGLWGGEEDGIVGSQFWISTNPDKVAFIDGYFNFDVTPLAFPAPAVDPAPLVIAAGPDQTTSPALFAYAQQIEDTWLQSGAEFIFETVVGGQATGAGVNAQSDHTPFVMRGVPSYFPFTSRVSDVFALIHSERDTLDNLQRYALLGIDGVDAELTPEEMLEGRDILARSFETPMYLAFYWFVLTDAGVLDTLTVAPSLPQLR